MRYIELNPLYQPNMEIKVMAVMLASAHALQHMRQSTSCTKHKAIIDVCEAKLKLHNVHNVYLLHVTETLATVEQAESSCDKQL